MKLKLFFAALLISLPPALVQAETATKRRPNIVFILADDLGFGDVGAYNADSLIGTPHLDRLAAEGMRDSFTHIPRTPPWSVMGFVLRSPSFTARDLARVDVAEALGLLDVAFPNTFSALDGRSAADVLDRLPRANAQPLDARSGALTAQTTNNQ